MSGACLSVEILVTHLSAFPSVCPSEMSYREVSPWGSACSDLDVGEWAGCDGCGDLSGKSPVCCRPQRPLPGRCTGPGESWSGGGEAHGQERGAQEEGGPGASEAASGTEWLLPRPAGRGRGAAGVLSHPSRQSRLSSAPGGFCLFNKK